MESVTEVGSDRDCGDTGSGELPFQASGILVGRRIALASRGGSRPHSPLVVPADFSKRGATRNGWGYVSR